MNEANLPLALTEQQVIEGNYMIAEFMGLECIKTPYEFGNQKCHLVQWGTMDEHGCVSAVYAGGDSWSLTDELPDYTIPYHRSWDWQGEAWARCYDFMRHKIRMMFGDPTRSKIDKIESEHTLAVNANNTFLGWRQLVEGIKIIEEYKHTIDQQ